MLAGQVAKNDVGVIDVANNLFANVKRVVGSQDTIVVFEAIMSFDSSFEIVLEERIQVAFIARRRTSEGHDDKDVAGSVSHMLHSDGQTLKKSNVANNRIAADREAGCCNSG